MPTWLDLSRESRDAARWLREAGKWRSALSRAYYSLFAEVALALRSAGVTMPHGLEGPRHKPVIDGTLIAAHLSRALSAPEVGKLIYLVGESYRLRCIADYSPSVEVTRIDADQGIAILAQAAAILEKLR